MPPSSSADPPLTSLCGICHIEPPKYKCPACSTRTCSLPCSRKHKAWSSCSGVRDPTAYIPRSKLKTPAGIDHDYNFLSAIERARQRSEREIVEERHLVTENQLRPAEVQTVQWRRRKDGSKQKVLVTQAPRPSGPAAGRPELSKQMKKRLATFDINVRRLPLGMTRQKENGTNVHRASGRIHWQVEWLLLENTADTVQDVKQAEKNIGEKGPDWKRTRIMSKAMDDTPLYAALVQAQVAQANRLRKESQQTRDNPEASSTHPAPSKARQKPPPGHPVDVTQDPITGTWRPGHYPFQPYPDSAWKSRSGTVPFTGVVGVDPAQASKFNFYLASSSRATTTHHNKTVVHPVDSTTILAEALRETTVIEFPTIYALPSSVPLPPTLAACPRNPRPKEAQRETSQRDRNDGSLRLQSNRKRPRHVLEDGEVTSEDEETGLNGSLSGGEDVDLVSEESLGEEADENDIDTHSDADVNIIADDTTSSSGSDISSDESDSSSTN
ncbi:hypothetical protein ACRALDRAFT_1067675 [Sodiomyces alcalophilus JCM 7366]|uniref:uncharacterized protein n=1 Tax=Sodiomyces alcalophilus JCM 7366 TaxID=591952 RepID=UPI0039B44663